MTVKATPPRLQIALLTWFLDNEPLAGDLIEESAHRSRTWFWQQLMFALLVRTATRAAAALRDPADLLAPLASLAMFMVLCFQVVVAGSLLASVLPRARVAGQEWLALVVLLSLPVGWGTGKVVGPLRARSRVATVALCGASAAGIGLVVHVVLSSTAAVIFPAVGIQAVAAMVFVSGLLIGAGLWLIQTRSGLSSNGMSTSASYLT
jgi:hypothetical protein